MADKSQKNLKNVNGTFYVDETCIDCGLCYQTVSDYFAKDEESGKAYIFKQPFDEEGIAKCEDVLGNCPVNSIGDDG